MKKTISLLLVIVLIVGTTPFTLATNVSTEEMTDYLLEKGFPEVYLDTLIEQQIESLYNMSLGDNVYFGGIETVVLDSNDSLVRGNISSSQLSYTVAFVLVTQWMGNEQYITELRVKVSYDWLTLPIIRGTDSIAVNWDSSIFTYDGGFSSYNYARALSTGNWITHGSWTAPSTLNQGGLGIYAYLDYAESVLGQTVQAVGLKGETNFRLVPKITWSLGFFPGSNVTSVNAEYTHNKNPLGGSLSFSYSGFQVTIGGGVLTDSIAAYNNLYYTAM